MKRPQITMKGLMVAILGLAVAGAALVRPTKLWAMALAALLFSLCCTAILGVALRRGPKRAFWIGFAVFGWGYVQLMLVMTSGPKFNGSPFSFSGALGESIVILTGLFMILGEGEADRMHQLLAEVVDLVTGTDDVSRFLVVSSMLGLAFAAVGGRIALAFFSPESLASRPVEPPDGPRRPAGPN